MLSLREYVKEPLETVTAAGGYLNASQEELMLTLQLVPTFNV